MILDEKKEVAISVIVPIYNTRLYIEQCLDSIINQTFRNIEIILVDDGSDDGSERLCDKYEEMDSRVRVIHQKNKGLLESRRVGLRNAEGKYVFWADSDDWMCETLLEKMYTCAEKEQVDVICCGYYSVNGKTQVVCDNKVAEGKYSSKENTIFPSLTDCLYDVENGRNILTLSFWTKLFVKEKIAPFLNGFHGKIEVGEDIAIIWPFMVSGVEAYIINEPLYYYRVRANSSCHKANPNLLIETSILYRYIYDVYSTLPKSDKLIKLLKCYTFDQLMQGTFFSQSRMDFFMFPYEKVPANSNIILYGAGMAGKSFYRQIIRNHYCNIKLWCDKNYQNITSGYSIVSPELIKTSDFDYILIAVVNYEHADKIAKEISDNYGVTLDRIITAPARKLSAFMDFE